MACMMTYNAKLNILQEKYNNEEISFSRFQRHSKRLHDQYIDIKIAEKVRKA
jgi:hypothetical protein